MDKMNLLERVNKRRGARRHIAVALGISYNRLSLMLGGYQKLPEELEAKIIKYLTVIEKGDSLFYKILSDTQGS